MQDNFIESVMPGATCYTTLQQWTAKYQICYKMNRFEAVNENDVSVFQL